MNALEDLLFKENVFMLTNVCCARSYSTESWM